MMSTAFTLEPATPEIGAVVGGLDLATAAGEPATIEALERALDERLVLLFRGQRLAPGQFVGFVKAFGPLLDLKRTYNPGAVHVPGHVEIKVLSNAVTDDDRPLGDGNAGEQVWHTDGAAKERPPAYTVFYAREIPPQPPHTYWLDMQRAYDTLPQAMKVRIAGLRAIHHFYPRSNEAAIDRDGPTLDLAARRMGPRHPLVRRHARTARLALFLPTRRDSLIQGMEPAGSRVLLDELWGHVRAQTCIWGTSMQVDDLVIWDNRVCVHRRDGWSPALRRVMWHMTNEGEVPAAAED